VRVVVIGGTGFIGAHIVRQIASHEHTVAVILTVAIAPSMLMRLWKLSQVERAASFS
jgi:nucleoside-diphosphate-sugar epimerase